MCASKVRSLNGIDRKDQAASPAISTVIITSVTVILVLVAGSYARQTLERQRGASEFEAAKKSIQTFDDAARDVAWDRGGFRSVPFTFEYGHLEVVPNAFPLQIDVIEYPSVQAGMQQTGYIRYRISTKYITLGAGYESYILGNNETVVSTGTESLGCALVTQESGRINTALKYRVRAMRTSIYNVSEGEEYTLVNYVDILIVKITSSNRSIYTGEFDLVAQNKGINTTSYGPFLVNGNDCTISVSLGASSSSVNLDLVDGKVVFNFIVANVEVGV